MITQCDRVLDYMKNTGPINPLLSWTQIGVYRLSARIFDLKGKGHDVKSRSIVVQNMYGEGCTVKQYYMESESEN